MGSSLLHYLKILYTTPEPTPCDVLFLHTCTTSQQRAKNLCEALEQRGLNVSHAMVTVKQLLLHRMLYKPDKGLPAEFLFDDALAKFLVRKYQPKVVCSFSGIAASFLREELQKENGGKNIFITHGIFFAPNDHTNFDCDYWFIYGKSSLEKILASSIRVGNTKAILTGSPFITSEYNLQPNFGKKNLLFFSSWGAWWGRTWFSKSKMNPFREQFWGSTQVVIEWAKQHPEFHLLIKIHPVENPKFMQELIEGIPNITILDKSTSMVNALKNVSLVINICSHASTEAAQLNRPIVLVDATDSWKGFLDMDRFFLPAARNVEELHHNILQTFESFDKFLEKTQEFCKFHLERTTDSVDFMADCIASICRGEEDFPYTPIPEKLSGLQPYFVR